MTERGEAGAPPSSEGGPSAPAPQVPRADNRPELPTGTVTFLFTDLEGSTRLWEEHPEAMRSALARHDGILRDAIAAHDGHIVKTTGDGVHAAFARPLDALEVAVAAQLALTDVDWETPEPLRVRMGIHTGAADLRDGDYYGTSLNRAARLMSAAHGGQIVVSLATEELVRDDLRDGMGLVDLGEHGLRDLARAERVFQVAQPSLRRDFPRLRSLDAFPGNLPAQITSFIGRDAELQLVGKALDSSRVVTLTGVGGVGKTRLAVHAAAEMLPRFPDGGWLCELAAAEDADTMAQVVSAALGAPNRPGMSLESSILEYLAGKRLLVVLDNCEHLLDAAARLAEAIVRDCPDVWVLATSREVLVVEGEHVVGLRSLSLPDTTDSTTDVATSDAVRLFVERAQAARTGFELDPAGAIAVAEICRRLDGIPLAIELAAARVGAMSPSEIAGLLDERFRLLRGGRRTALERHQTLRATVDWSYSLLSDVERAVFGRLAVFAGTFDASGARAVTSGDDIGEWDVLDALGSLVAKSMLVADTSADGLTRYQMLETLRAYARERLDEVGESDAWRRRHAVHYAGFAAGAQPELLGPNEVAWRRQLRAELDNLRAAVFWALDSDREDDRDLGMGIIAYLATEVTLDRSAGFGSWAERALPFVETTTPARRTAVLGTAAFSAFDHGDLDRARELALAALRDGVPEDCPSPILPYVALSCTELHFGRYDEAIRILDEGREALAHCRHAEYAQSNLLAVRADFLAAYGDRASALPDAEVSLAGARRLANPSQLAIALCALGTACFLSDPNRARDAFEESLALTASGASDVNVAEVSVQLAELLAQVGEYRRALASLRHGIRHADSVGHKPAFAGHLSVAVEVMGHLGRNESAALMDGAVVTHGYGLTLGDQEAHGASLGRARAELGDDRYQQLRARGAAWSYDEMVAEVFTLIDDALADVEASDA